MMYLDFLARVHHWLVSYRYPVHFGQVSVFDLLDIISCSDRDYSQVTEPFYLRNTVFLFQSVV